MKSYSDEKCLRCEGTMQCLGSQYIQLGKASFWGGTWGNVLAGALEVNVLVCSECGKIEFYQFDDRKREIPEELPFEKCSKCGEEHNTGLAMCPACIMRKFGV